MDEKNKEILADLIAAVICLGGLLVFLILSGCASSYPNSNRNDSIKEWTAVCKEQYRVAQCETRGVSTSCSCIDKDTLQDSLRWNF